MILDLEEVRIIYDKERTRQIFEKYFKYEQQRELKKLPVWLGALVCCALIASGLALKIRILWIIGCVSIGISVLYLLVFLIRFQLVRDRSLKELDQRNKSMDMAYTFYFDSNTIKYVSENHNSETKWTAIRSYSINGDDVYLYLANNELFDIISKQLLGPEKYDKFVQIIRSQLQAPQSF